MLAERAGNPAKDEQIVQEVDDIGRVEPTPDPDCQILADKFVEHVPHAIFPPIMGAVLDEVVGPNMAGIFRQQPDAGAIRQPMPPVAGPLREYPQPFPPPDPLAPAYG